MSDDKVVPLFPGKPNAIELFSDTTNIEVEELTEDEIDALAEIQEDGELAGHRFCIKSVSISWI
jgi:hypothetical protein